MDEGGVDIATLGLRLNATEFRREGERSVEVLDDLDASQKRLTRGTKDLEGSLRQSASAAEERSRAWFDEVVASTKAGESLRDRQRDYRELGETGEFFEDLGAASREAGEGVGAVEEGIQRLVREVASGDPVLQQSVSILGSLALSGGVMVGALAGMAALSAAWDRLTRDARENRIVTERALEFLRELQERRGQGPTGVTGASVTQAREAVAALEEQLRIQEQVARSFEGTEGAFVATGRADAIRRELEETKRLLEAGVAEELAIIDGLNAERRKRTADELAFVVSTNRATQQERDQALRELEGYAAAVSNLEAQIASAGSPEEAERLNATRLEYARILDQLKGAFEGVAAAEERAAEVSRRALREEQQAAVARRQELLRAIDLNTATRDNINEVRDRYLEIQRILRDDNTELEERNRLRAEELVIAQQLADVGFSATRRFDGDFTPRIGPVAQPGLGVARNDPIEDSDRVSAFAAEIKRMYDELDRLIQLIRVAGISAERAEFEAVTNGLLSLGDALGSIPDSVVGAVDGISSVVSGILQFKEAEKGAAGTLTRIAGATGLAGGIISLGVSIFDSASEASRQIEAARERAIDELEAFGSGFTGFAAEVNRAVGIFDGLTNASGLESNPLFRQLLSGFVDLEEVLGPLGATTLSATEAVDAFARAAAALGDPELVRLSNALTDALNDRRRSFEEDLELRRVAAFFGEEAASQLRLQYDFEMQLAEARALGLDVTKLLAVQEQELANLREAQQKRAQEEAQREREAFEREMERRERRRSDFLRSLERDEAFRQGEGIGSRFDVQAGYDDAVAAIDEALAAGIITAEEYDRAIANATNTMLDGFADIEAAERAAAEAIADATLSLERQTALIWLSIEGRDEEIFAMERQIEFERRLKAAREAGVSEDTIAEWIAAWDEQTRQIIEDRESIGREEERSRRAAPSSSRINVAGVTEAEVFRTNDILFSQLSVQQQIAADIRAMSRTGSLVQSAGGGPLRIDVQVTVNGGDPGMAVAIGNSVREGVDQALGSQARRTSFQRGRMRL